ncbi:MAG: (2Fe-2S) ferredoxin domain-containing protein, partial [Deltaproteobacteria bacterium]|nr:(2Fe-2S) ferredoxin domain-containing protein [Deltaproteobacteria bacterium]
MIQRQDSLQKLATMSEGDRNKIIDQIIAELVAEEMKKQGLDGKILLKKTGCHGFCERGPVVVLHPQEIFYQRVAPKDVADIVSETFQQGKVAARLLYTDPQTNQKITRHDEIPFYKF